MRSMIGVLVLGCLVAGVPARAAGKVDKLPQLRDWYIQAGGGPADDHHWRQAA